MSKSLIHVLGNQEAAKGSKVDWANGKSLLGCQHFYVTERGRIKRKLIARDVKVAL